MKKTLALILALGLMLSMFSGCSGNTAPQTENEGTDSGGAAPDSGAATPGEEVQPRDCLNIGEYDEEWVASDLIQGDTFYDLQMMMAEPLFLYSHETGDLEACLAEAPAFNEEGTVMTFSVPEGRCFPNGATLGADDVCASLQHGIDSGAMSDTFSIITNIAYEGNTVTLTLSHYSTALLILLVSPFFCVIDTEQLNTMSNEELLWGAVPYGAYYISEYTEGSGVTLTRNDGFKTLNSTVENQGASYIPTIKVTWYEDEFAMIAAYQAGQLDMLIGVTEDSVDALQNMDGVVVSSSLPPMVRNVQLNANSEFLADYNVRLAIAYLIDRELIVDAFGGDLMCTGQYEYITDNVMYHVQDVEDWYKQTYANNVDKAKQLLSEAGWTDTDGDGILDKNGVKMPTLTFNTASGKNETAALTIQIMLQQAGFDVQVVTTSESTSLAQEGKYDLTMCNYWWSEPGRFLVNMFKDHNDFDETEYREIVTKVETTTDNAERFELVEQAEKYLMEKMIVIPLYTTSYIKIYDKSLSNIHFIVDGMFLNDIR
ncbi:MAG: ABC transporter substrate-binding protein [Clostridiaceae bacterium]|nr:ABC transporter substrate-binding protein [Clostridiaceae bacterium]